MPLGAAAAAAVPFTHVPRVGPCYRSTRCRCMLHACVLGVQTTRLDVPRCLLRPPPPGGSGASYCDEHQYICLFVCVFLCPLAYLRNHAADLRQSFVRVRVAEDRSSVTALRYVVYFGLVGDVTFSHNGLYGASCVFPCGERENRGAEAPRGGTGVPLPNRLRGLGDHRELPQWGPGQSPGHQCIFGIFEAHRTAHKKLNFS